MIPPKTYLLGLIKLCGVPHRSVSCDVKSPSVPAAVAVGAVRLRVGRAEEAVPKLSSSVSVAMTVAAGLSNDFLLRLRRNREEVLGPPRRRAAPVSLVN